MQRQNFGFEIANRYILHPSILRWRDYKAERLPAFYRHLHDNLAAIPGVIRVSFALYTPMEGNNWGETVYIEGQAPPPPGSSQNQTSWLRVTDGYFESVGTRIVKGRTITEQDTATYAESRRRQPDLCQQVLQRRRPDRKALWRSGARSMRETLKSSASPRIRNTGGPPTRSARCSSCPRPSTSCTTIRASRRSKTRHHFLNSVVLQDAGPRAGT